MAETDRLGAYANWLVANKAKQGTPEFETVANAYRSLRSPAPAPDTSMGTAFKVGEAGAVAATQGYVADANRQMEQGPVGRFMQLGEDYVAKPIADALGIDRQPRAAAVAESQRELDGNYAASAATRDKLLADTNYKSLTTDDIDGVGSFLRYGGQKIAESAGPMAATIATGGTLTMPMMAGEVNENLKDIEGLSEEDRIRLATGGGVIGGVLENLGVGYLFKGVSKEALSKMGVAGVSRVLEKNGLGRLTSRVAAGVATEGLTEAAQEGVSIGAEAIGGREFTAEDVKSRLFEAGVAGGVAGGGFRGAGSIAGGVTDSVKSAPREDTPENRANASFAQRIQRISTTGDVNGTPFNLKDVNSGSQHGVRAAMDAAHTDLVGQIANDAKVLRESLTSKDTDPFDLALEKVQAQVGLKMARNKTKSVVTKDNFDALEKLVGHTEEGQNLLNLVRESQVLTTLHNNEYKGGVSRFTDFAHPFDNAQNGYNVGAQVARNITSPSTSLGLAVYTGGGSIPYQAGVVAAGRGIDAITGRRSRVNRFVNKNKDAAGLEIPAGLPSIRQGRIDDARLAEDQKAASEAASAASLAQRTERLKQSNKQLLKDGAPPVPTSPQGTLEEATGLDNSGVAKVLRTIEATNTDPVLKEAIDSYRTSVVYGGRVPEISSLIRKVKQMTTKYPTLAPQVRTPVDRPDATGSPIGTSPENYQRGIDDNKAMLQDLKDGAKTDPTMSPADKAKVLGALDEMGLNLGTDPAGKVNEILSGLDGVDPDAVAAYVEPYAARVMGQQDAAPRSSVVHIDNPRGDWLKSKQRYAEEDMAKGTRDNATSKGLSGPTTAYTRVVNLPVSLLVNIQGAMGEKPAAGQRKFDDLSKSVAADGFKSDSPILVGVNHKGQPYILEGNNRVAVASINGIQTIPAEVRWFNGGEEAQGNFTPDVVTAAARSTDAVPRSSQPVQGAGVLSGANPPISSPPKFGGKTDVSLDTSLANAFTLAKDEVFAKGRDLKMRLQEMSLKAQEREGIDLTTLDDANIDRLADFVVADALEAIKDNANAIGWYDRTITQALETVGQLHPEVLTDPKAKLQLIWAVAVTSNGLKVDKNFEIALAAYQGLKDTGSFPTDIGIGQAASAIDGGLAQYHTMLDKFNRMSNSDEGAHDLLIEFMNSQIPVKQLEKEYGVKISGEGKNTLVRGASILGPKIGNGFFSNLYGNFDELTMDRWLMRTVGRWRGSLVVINKPMITKKTSEIQGMLSSADLKAMKPLFNGSGVSLRKKMTKSQVEDLANAIAKASMDPSWRKAINAIEGGENLRKAGNGLAKYLDGQVEAPAGAKERDFIREVFKRGLKQLQNLPEIKNGSNTELTMSDLQALLWYPEKRLYDTAKQKDGGESRGYEDDEAPDYANAARKSVQDRLERGDRLGSTGGTGPAGGGPIGPNAGQPRQSIQGGGILSGVNPPNNPAASSPPKVAEVKQEAAFVNAALQIGLKGSDLENGIKDMAGVEKLAATYNIVLKFHASNSDMRQAVPSAKDTASGVYSPSTRTAHVVRTGDTQELVTALHEVMHGVGLNSVRTGNYVGEAPTTNGLTGQPDVMGIGSLEVLMDYVLGMDKSDPRRRTILAELKHIQDLGQFTSGGVSVPIRGAKSMAMMLKNAKKQYEINGADFEASKAKVRRELKDHQNYERSIGELTVDALVMYGHDPKGMKRVAPETARLVRELFNKSGNKKIQFYNHPLAMVVAVVMAILAKSQAPEEEEQQMPAGALSPQLGILSA